MAEERAGAGQEERLPLALLLGTRADPGEGLDDEAGWNGAGVPHRELDESLLVVEKIVHEIGLVVDSSGAQEGFALFRRGEHPLPSDARQVGEPLPDFGLTLEVIRHAPVESLENIGEPPRHEEGVLVRPEALAGRLPHLPLAFLFGANGRALLRFSTAERSSSMPNGA